MKVTRIGVPTSQVTLEDWTEIDYYLQDSPIDNSIMADSCVKLRLVFKHYDQRVDNGIKDLTGKRCRVTIEWLNDESS